MLHPVVASPILTLLALPKLTLDVKVVMPAVTTKPPASILTPVLAVTKPTESTFVTSS